MLTKSLAQFISETREKAGLSRSGLVNKTALSQELIEDIETGKVLFLSTTERQRIASALKISPSAIKKYEKTYHEAFDRDTLFESDAKRRMEEGETEIFCPICGTKLVIRRINRFDIEDNPVTDYKASCPKCTLPNWLCFQSLEPSPCA